MFSGHLLGGLDAKDTVEDAARDRLAPYNKELPGSDYTDTEKPRSQEHHFLTSLEESAGCFTRIPDLLH